MALTGRPMTPMSPQPTTATNPTNMISPQQIPVVDQQVDWSSKTAEVMREQFGLRSKQQSVMYKTPYPSAYDQIPLPHKYKMSDFTSSRDTEKFLQWSMLTSCFYSWEKRATMMHSESIYSHCLCLDRPLFALPLC